MGMLNTAEMQVLLQHLVPNLTVQSRWLTLKEACEYAKVQRDLMMTWAQEGLVYGTKKKGKWIIDRTSIDDFYNMERGGCQ